ncbi:dihydrofolate reductase family protein [Amycolatopsis ultiminotia]|uniref:Dihydrofolate reductase family protein n=1 Tax=Amycolatopsis ultiminotia TaxID=543629 RepID=A0ABP6X0P0_9PSEU
MGRVIVANWVTLDGVMQAPGLPDEDTRDGFTQGGWAAPYADPVMGAKMSELMTGDYAWLFGRTSYQGLLESWDRQGGPFKDALNNRTKYVASGAADTHLAWPNSILLHGDVPAEVARLKENSAANLVIMGSRVLINSLVAADLIDEYLLMIAPLVLGSGRRLFLDGTHTALQLRECTPVGTGAVAAVYERDRRQAQDDAGRKRGGADLTGRS